MMKKIPNIQGVALGVALSFLSFLLHALAPVLAADKVTVYFFWGAGCPHCESEKAFLEGISRRFPLLDVKYLEVRKNKENAKVFTQMAEAHKIKVKGVPTTFIGDFDPIIGYRDDATTGRDIEEKLRYCIEHSCVDPAARLADSSGPPALSEKDLTGSDDDVCGADAACPDEQGASSGDMSAAAKEQTPPRPEKKGIIKLPIFGEIDSTKTALTYQTIIIAGLDGFNPCAFFVLVTLLGLLIHAQSRRRVLFIGGVFVFFSGMIYFLFMAAWLNIFLMTGAIEAVTIGAGLVALAIAGINIKDFFFFKKGVSLSIPEHAKPKLFDRMRRLMRATSFSSVIVGTVVLAAAANAYELFCTAGFPMVYTRILTLHNLSRIQYYLYLFLYNAVYVVPLAIIVLFFALTLGSRKLTEWQGQVLKLVSGIMMLLLGLVLLTMPDLLNNVFMTAGILAAAVTASLTIVFVARRRRTAV